MFHPIKAHSASVRVPGTTTSSLVNNHRVSDWAPLAFAVICLLLVMSSSSLLVPS